MVLQKYGAQISVCGCHTMYFLGIAPCWLLSGYRGFIWHLQCACSVCHWHQQNELPSFGEAIAEGSSHKQGGKAPPWCGVNWRLSFWSHCYGLFFWWPAFKLNQCIHSLLALKWSGEHIQRMTLGTVIQRLHNLWSNKNCGWEQSSSGPGLVIFTKHRGTSWSAGCKPPTSQVTDLVKRDTPLRSR